VFLYVLSTFVLANFNVSVAFAGNLPSHISASEAAAYNVTSLLIVGSIMRVRMQVRVSVDGTLRVYLLEANIELQFNPSAGFDYVFNLTDPHEIIMSILTKSCGNKKLQTGTMNEATLRQE
jgi:hypothetical protein